MEDAKLLKDTAFETAKNALVEAFTPQIKEFIDSQLGAPGSLSEMPEELTQLSPEELQKLLQLVQGMGMEMGVEPEVSEPSDMHMNNMDGVEEEMYEGLEEEVNEEVNEEMGMDEVVDVTQEDIRQAFSEAIQDELSEATVSKGFGDAENPNTNATGGLGDEGVPGERGLEDPEKEKMWKDETPPAAKDWYGIGGLKEALQSEDVNVREAALKAYVEMLQKENKDLQKENKYLTNGVAKLKRSLQETNLFNSKLLYTSKILQNANLNGKQRVRIIESFDQAQSLREVELVFKSLSESFKIAGVLGEGKKAPKANVTSRGSRYTTSASAGMLREEADKELNEQKDFRSRMMELSGINKKGNLID